MAASVAVQLSSESDVEVETARGGLGEFSVSIDGQKIVAISRFWYPTPSKVHPVFPLRLDCRTDRSRPARHTAINEIPRQNVSSD